MDELPPELFRLIFSYIGGAAFISLRRTCKRLKMLLDDFEMRLKPCIWYRYTYEDYSTMCIETLLPWLKETSIKTEKDSMIWKTVYSCLYRSKLRKGQFGFRQLEVTCALTNVDQMYFAGQQLIMYQRNAICLGLPTTFEPHILPITGLRHIHTTMGRIPIAYQELLPGTVSMNHLLYRPLNTGEDSLVKTCRDLLSSRISKYRKLPPVGNKSLFTSREYILAQKQLYAYAYNLGLMHPLKDEIYEPGILMMASGNRIFFCHHFSKDGGKTTKYVCSEQELPFFFIRAIQKVGKLLIASCDTTVFVPSATISRLPSGWLEGASATSHLAAADETRISEIRFGEGGKITLSKWSEVFGSNRHRMDPFSGITDFDVVGQIFVGLSKDGKVYISNLEECSYEHIQRNLFIAHTLPVRTAAYYYKISVDINDGVTIAALDTAKYITLMFIK